MTQLVKESGILEFPAALTVANIAAHIADHPDLVEQWLDWSANQRLTSAWYFRRQAGGYVVSFFPKGESLSFSEPALACAEFVIRVVEEYLALCLK